MTGTLSSELARETHAQTKFTDPNMRQTSDDDLRFYSQSTYQTVTADRSPPTTGTYGFDRVATDFNQPSDVHGQHHTNGTVKSDSPYDHGDEDIPENMFRPERNNPEGWIHRDKLAKIESEELQAAGINLAKARSKNPGRMEMIRDTPPSSSDGPLEHRRDEKRQRVRSPIQDEEDVERAAWDLRSPEEIADETAAAQVYTNPVLRKSGSRIPVLTSSTVPIPPERLERDTPINRKRSASATISLDRELLVSKNRSVSARMPEDGDNTTAATTNTGSSVSATGSQSGTPTRPLSKSGTILASPPRKTTPAIRKVSAPVRGTPSPGQQRLAGRGADSERPRTAVNRPEGDPPWLAAMYKPDPRLPPDQQLIPTLAKKQQQAQWMENGYVPKTYDRDFTALSVHTEDELSRGEVRPPVPSRDIRPEMNSKSNAGSSKSNSPNTDTGSPWSSKPPPPLRHDLDRPGTGGSVTGGYSTMPKVSSPPVGMKPFSPSLPASSPPAITTNGPPAVPPSRTKVTPTTSRNQTSNTTTPARPTAQQMRLEEENEKSKKSCGCCVVM